MSNATFRLYFIDVMRAFAICMMLQGHFVDGLLANEYRDLNSLPYTIWLFFRGLTAPVFFSVSGFIFMYLLAKEKTEEKIGWKHTRVRKGIKRGLTLVITAYLLRLHFWSLFVGNFYQSNALMIDVLHCIGLSLLFLIAIYLFSYRKNKVIMPLILLGFSLILFAFAPVYLSNKYDYLPIFLANYFTHKNGSVFTIFPWFGYASFGAFIGVLFSLFREHKKVYQFAILFTTFFGIFFSFFFQSVFYFLWKKTTIQLFGLMANDTIFNRLGNILLIFSVFMLLRDVIMSKTIRTIGQNTLSIYIIHYIILYGSFTGIGLYQFFHHRLNPYQVVIGALFFILVTIWLSSTYNKYKPFLEDKWENLKIKYIKNLK